MALSGRVLSFSLPGQSAPTTAARPARHTAQCRILLLRRGLGRTRIGWPARWPWLRGGTLPIGHCPSCFAGQKPFHSQARGAVTCELSARVQSVWSQARAAAPARPRPLACKAPPSCPAPSLGWAWSTQSVRQVHPCPHSLVSAKGVRSRLMCVAGRSRAGAAGRLRRCPVLWISACRSSRGPPTLRWGGHPHGSRGKPGRRDER